MKTINELVGKIATLSIKNYELQICNGNVNEAMDVMAKLTQKGLAFTRLEHKND